MNLKLQRKGGFLYRIGVMKRKTRLNKGKRQLSTSIRGLGRIYRKARFTGKRKKHGGEKNQEREYESLKQE